MFRKNHSQSIQGLTIKMRLLPEETLESKWPTIPSVVVQSSSVQISVRYFWKTSVHFLIETPISHRKYIVLRETATDVSHISIFSFTHFAVCDVDRVVLFCCFFFPFEIHFRKLKQFGLDVFSASIRHGHFSKSA